MDEIKNERRKHKRYVADEDAIAVCDSKVGSVLNVSDGGMAVKFITNELFSENDKITILSRCKKLFVADLPVAMIREYETPFMPMSTFRLQTCGLKFNYSNAAQRDMIKGYIASL